MLIKIKIDYISNIMNIFAGLETFARIGVIATLLPVCFF